MLLLFLACQATPSTDVTQDEPTDLSDAATDAPTDDTDAPTDDTDETDAPTPSIAGCRAAAFPNVDAAEAWLPDYGANADATIGARCQGTDHQEIDGVERVVFIGDSITVGTPPTPGAGYYRVVLADRLADRFGLTPPDASWSRVALLDGVPLEPFSGDFGVCAKWGARTDDLQEDNSMIADCFPEATDYDKRTLVIMTIGGNDIEAITSDAFLPETEESAMTTVVDDAVRKMADALRWIKEPGRFPNGVFVVFADVYEYTDGTSELGTCPGADLIGYGREMPHRAHYEALMRSMSERYLDLAVETGTDMVFARDAFCGHGYARTDPDAPCYRAPDQDLWFDATCIHPSPAGHAALAAQFGAVIVE